MADMRGRVNAAMSVVRQVLKTNKYPVFVDDVKHRYADKFEIAEHTTNQAIACYLFLVTRLAAVIAPAGAADSGADKLLAALYAWGARDHSAVTLRFAATATCEYLRKKEREVESSVHSVKVTGAPKVESKTVTKVTEHIWNYAVKFRLSVFAGAAPDDPAREIELAASVEQACEIMTTTDQPPHPKSADLSPPLDVTLHWLVSFLKADGDRGRFRIVRSAESCRTPRRNDEIEAALSFDEKISSWAGGVCHYLTDLGRIEHRPVDYSEMTSTAKVFVPVLPLLYQDHSTRRPIGDDWGDNVALDVESSQALLAEFQRTVSARMCAMADTFAPPPKATRALVTPAVARLAVITSVMQDVAAAHSASVNFLEHLLRTALVSAIGKVVEPCDIGAYMLFHGRSVFLPQYEPQPLTYAVRRAGRYPEGVFSIEGQSLSDPTSSASEPIRTFVFEDRSVASTRFALSASTTVTAKGERYLHGGLLHRFGKQPENSLKLLLRSMQFSSFILMVGRVTGADSFEPTHAMIVRNKDELMIPLDLSTIPSAKEFRDAIGSLSPEQRGFAEAFRGMQLESTLFGVCVVQIKPQLELLLNLPAGALTKEIKLTEDLMDIFIRYQIPSDLVTYAGDPDAPLSKKIADVKQAVAAINSMVQKMKAAVICTTAEEALEQIIQIPDVYGSTEECYAPPMALEAPSRGRAMKPSAPKKMSMARAAPGGVGAPMMSFASANRAAPPPAMQMACAAPPPMPAPVLSGGLSSPPPPPPASTTAPPPLPSQVETKPQPSEVKDKPSVAESDRVLAPEPSDSSAVFDFTQMPRKLESAFDAMDARAPVRPTILNIGAAWTQRFYRNIIAEIESKSVNGDSQKEKKKDAFDLLDALSRSGALDLSYSRLHVVVLSTYNFAQTVIDTVIVDNVDPLEKLERGVLVLASTIYGVPASQLVHEEHVDRVAAFSVH